MDNTITREQASEDMRTFTLAALLAAGVKPGSTIAITRQISDDVQGKRFDLKHRLNPLNDTFELEVLENAETEA